MKRYDLVQTYRGYSCDKEMLEEFEGDWVKFEEVEAELAKKDAEIAELVRSIHAKETEIAGLKIMLKRASRHISLWWDCYGSIKTEVLPPSGSIQLTEDIDLAIAAKKEQAK